MLLHEIATILHETKVGDWVKTKPGYAPFIAGIVDRIDNSGIAHLRPIHDPNRLVKVPLNQLEQK